jgi:hypothetical protein
MLRRLHPKQGLPLTVWQRGGTLKAGSKKWKTGKMRVKAAPSGYMIHQTEEIH